MEEAQETVLTYIGPKLHSNRNQSKLLYDCNVGMIKVGEGHIKSKHSNGACKEILLTFEKVNKYQKIISD